MTRRIEIERVPPDFCGEFNTNNHPCDPNDNEITGLNYEHEIDRTRLSKYMDLIDYPCAWTYTFTDEEISTLTDCAVFGRETKSGHLYRDDLTDIIARLETVWQVGTWFFRLDCASPKDGNPVFPVQCARDAVYKLITSKRALTSLLRGDRTVYFVPFARDWDRRCEYRVFVYRGRVTAISQYDAYGRGSLSSSDDSTVIDTANRIVDYLETEILDRVCSRVGTQNVTCDVYVDDNAIRIIEFNSFGYWLAAGSSLFHWIKDRTKLYNTDGTVWVRIVN